MKNNKGMTLIELIVSMVLLSIILLFLRTLVSNLAFNEVDKEYDDNVMRDLLVDNIQENLIHFGLAYEEKNEEAVSINNEDKSITINTLGGKAILWARNVDDQYEIIYNDVYGKNAIWTLSEELIADLDNISVNLGNNNDKGKVYLSITIPIYEVDKEDKDNNNTYNDFIVNYYGKNIQNNGTYIEPKTTDSEELLTTYLSNNVSLWDSGLVGDGSRFVGTNPDNYICFGTSDKSTCTGNPNTYMYRIIGIFKDSNRKYHVKLIKKRSLGSYAWHSSNSSYTSWEKSNLYNGLNGSYFLNNTTYVPSEWKDKIENWTWSSVNTKTKEDRTNNVDYYYTSPKGIYLHEMNRGVTSKICRNYDVNDVGCDKGEWTTPESKIGLMYASDYALSLGSSTLKMDDGIYKNKDTLLTSWMFSTNSDSNNGTYEWTMVRFGSRDGRYDVWYIRHDGVINGNGLVYNTVDVRPVFYLTSDVKYVSGTGSLTDPYMIY